MPKENLPNHVNPMRFAENAMYLYGLVLNNRTISDNIDIAPPAPVLPEQNTSVPTEITPTLEVED